ncbi:Putative PKHD-type hydroxylase [Durusdinium trenchii]|uniref:PKHD-type hydroxylase n=1 Tax=Durusdinium trenchii TaxID=1381693 RepID=A0ABP0KM48_9DINO
MISSRSPRQAIVRTSNWPKTMEDGLKPSMLSRYFASQRKHVSPEERIQATLSDLADSVCRTLHQTSQKHKPCARYLLEGLPRVDRQETLAWMAQAFDVMNFPQTLFFDTALLLDRYYACLPREDLSTADSQRRLLAAVCVAIKTGSNAETQLPLRQVVTHLGHDEVSFDDVIAAELCILRKLRYDVGTPTPYDFLEALSARLKDFQLSPENFSLADYLLQLSLADVIFHYRYPHAVLTAAALLLALSCTGAASAAHGVVLEDLALHCEDADQNGMLAQCSRELHALWTMACSQEQNLYVHHLKVKFAKRSLHAVSLLQAPLTPALLLCGARQGANPDLPELGNSSMTAYSGLRLNKASDLEKAWTSSTAFSYVRRATDRERLWHEILRVAKGSQAPVTPLGLDRISQADYRRPRAASWCGQRPARTTVKAGAARSP